MTLCPVCFASSGAGDLVAVAQHLADAAATSDAGHVRWLNQNITPIKQEVPELTRRLESLYRVPPEGLGRWIKREFIARFYGRRPHPFVLALQHPSRATLLGYVVEHQHFLRQWVRSCGFILARSGEPEVIRYEVDNIDTEFTGLRAPTPAHYELLLRMGESLGLSRATVLATPPLTRTRKALEAWDRICRERHWVAAMAAMHGLELIAHRGLVEEGATISYFDPRLLSTDEIPAAARAFLREGYEADVSHSDEALALVERFARDRETTQEVQSVFLRSVELFDDYLMARLQRAEEYETPA